MNSHMFKLVLEKAEEPEIKLPTSAHPGCSLEGMMLKLKLQYFGHLMQRVDLLEKILMLEGLGAGGEGDNRG